MVTGKFLTGKDDLSHVFQIREEVFCKEQNIAKELERDAWDQGAIHVLIHDHGCKRMENIPSDALRSSKRNVENIMVT